ncbi:MAG: hypothetical protein LUC50_02810 [Ruminococcus sp.]|nr:hypothetical protein [Ruminococcus sp.]
MMTRKKRLAALGIAAVLAWGIGSAVYTPGSAAADTALTDIAESSVQENAVIVMYQGTSALQSATLSRAVQSEVEVVDSYVFDTTEDDALQVQVQGVLIPDSGFVISLVQSDTLSSEELMEQLEGQPNVLAVQPNHWI